MIYLHRDKKVGLPRTSPGSQFGEYGERTALTDVFNRTADALIMTAGGRVTYVNPAAEQLLGESHEDLHGQPLDSVLTLEDGATREPVSILGAARWHGPFTGAFHLLVRRDGISVPVQCTVTPTEAESGSTSGYMVLLRNASVVQQYIDKLRTQSMHDEHTRLLRRAELVKRLWRLLQEADDGESQAFMYLDLDNFKSLNDTAGHAAGDLAIRQIASRFKEVVRGRDTLARLGGDEFGLLLERCPAACARQRANQLHRAVESYALEWNGTTFRVGVSIGLAIFKTRAHSLNTILGAADAACYEAKRSGDRLHIREVALD